MLLPNISLALVPLFLMKLLLYMCIRFLTLNPKLSRSTEPKDGHEYEFGGPDGVIATMLGLPIGQNSPTCRAIVHMYDV